MWGWSCRPWMVYQKFVQKSKDHSYPDKNKPGFGHRTSISIVTADCRILFHFWSFTERFSSHMIGEQETGYAGATMRFLQSKTSPARENKPFPDRSPQLGERCRFLFTVGFCCPKTLFFVKEWGNLESLPFFCSQNLSRVGTDRILQDPTRGIPRKNRILENVGF